MRRTPPNAYDGRPFSNPWSILYYVHAAHPHNSSRRHVTVVTLDHALHGGGGLGDVGSVLFPTSVSQRSLGHKHNRLWAQTLLDLQRFFLYTFAFLSNKVFTRCFFVVGGKTNWSERCHVNARIGNLFSKHLLAIFLTSQNHYMNRMLRKNKWIKWGIFGCCRPILSLPNHLIRAKLNYWMAYMSVYLPGRQGRISAL